MCDWFREPPHDLTLTINRVTIAHRLALPIERRHRMRCRENCASVMNWSDFYRQNSDVSIAHRARIGHAISWLNEPEYAKSLNNDRTAVVLCTAFHSLGQKCPWTKLIVRKKPCCESLWANHLRQTRARRADLFFVLIDATRASWKWESCASVAASRCRTCERRNSFTFLHVIPTLELTIAHLFCLCLWQRFRRQSMNACLFVWIGADETKFTIKRSHIRMRLQQIEKCPVELNNSSRHRKCMRKRERKKPISYGLCSRALENKEQNLKSLSLTISTLHESPAKLIIFILKLRVPSLCVVHHGRINLLIYSVEKKNERRILFQYSTAECLSKGKSERVPLRRICARSISVRTQNSSRSNFMRKFVYFFDICYFLLRRSPIQSQERK